jgi:hypothetical protein
MALEITIGQGGGRTMTGTGDVEHIQVVFLDDPIQMDPNERLAGIGSPVAQEAVLDVVSH